MQSAFNLKLGRAKGYYVVWLEWRNGNADSVKIGPILAAKIDNPWDVVDQIDSRMPNSSILGWRR